MPREAVISQFLIGLFVYSTIAGILYAVDAAAITRRQRERLAEARAAQAHLELRVLRSQLNPHFLFNTLHSLHALVQEEPAEAMRAIERFGGLLRYTLAANREPSARVTLAEEWAFVESYLALESMRLGDRLRLEVRIEPEALGCPLPAFTLQPLVENAIRHGVAPRPGGGELTVAGRRVGDLLELSVADDGPGVGPARLAALRAGLNGGVGEPPGGPRNGRGGLLLVARGLAAVYGDRHRFKIASDPGGGFRVELSLPVTADDDGREAETE